MKKHQDMRTQSAQFKDIVEIIYELPLDVRLELKNLLELNIAEARRDEIAGNYKNHKRNWIPGFWNFHQTSMILRRSSDRSII